MARVGCFGFDSQIRVGIQQELLILFIQWKRFINLNFMVLRKNKQIRQPVTLEIVGAAPIGIAKVNSQINDHRSSLCNLKNQKEQGGGDITRGKGLQPESIRSKAPYTNQTGIGHGSTPQATIPDNEFTPTRTNDGVLKSFDCTINPKRTCKTSGRYRDTPPIMSSIA